MILLFKTSKIGDNLEYKIYNSETTFLLENVSSHLDGAYVFREPAKGAENDRFMIINSGNKKTIYEDMMYDVAHYILLKQDDKSQYLIEKQLFDHLFKRN
ncbi:hypothetical protein [Flavobacterium luteolum]|uniref:hypothetical protein n=1 Tax=Flavobacterium luteolum TaxID=3003259 RepID=UPI00248DC0FC|nr:hypothetical protein [Flavobacterium luteolum]